MRVLKAIPFRRVDTVILWKEPSLVIGELIYH